MKSLILAPKTLIMSWYLIVKYGLTAGMVVLISEIAKRADKLGALISSLPLITFMTLFWLYIEKQPTSKISNHAYYTFWYVLPTLPMFLLFPYVYERWGFAWAIGASILLTIVLFLLLALILKRFGIILM